MEQDLHPWEAAVKKQRFLHPQKPLHWRGDQPGQKGASEAQRRVEQLVCGRQKRGRPAQMVCAIALWALGTCTPATASVGSCTPATASVAFCLGGLACPSCHLSRLLPQWAPNAPVITSAGSCAPAATSVGTASVGSESRSQ